MPLTAIIGKPGTTNIGRQVLRGALLGLVLVPTLLVWVAVGSSFFGYRVADAWGTSVEPNIHNVEGVTYEVIVAYDSATGTFKIISYQIV